VIGAALTPFAPDGSVLREALERIVDDLVSHCQAVSVLGAEVTEYSVMSAAQRREVLRESILMVGGRVPTLAGATSTSVSEVAELAELAQDAGATAIQVLIPSRPGGGPASAPELVRFFRTVCGSVSLPVVAYHNPHRGTDANAEAMVAIGEVPGVCALKESSRDMTKIAKLCAAIDGEGHARYFTTMQPLLATLQYGGSGAMAPSTGALLAARVYQFFAEGRMTEAADAQRAFARFPGDWGRFGLTAVMKAATQERGLDTGAAPHGFGVVDSDARDGIRRHLEGLGVLVGADR
jgi:4-hydroxy-tetrahydrodipicolinate synthase